MTTLNFNVNPYFDDFDASKNFYRVLYKPELAVQSRELNQQQAILQDQIKKFADHIFEDGSIVTGADHFLDLDVTYLKLKEQYLGQPINLDNFSGQVVVGQTSGAIGKVVHIEEKTETDDDVVYIKVLSKSFQDGEQIVADINNNTAELIDTDATGTASMAGIDEGVYYVNGHFVFVSRQQLILDKFDNTPSYRIGLSVVETLVDSDDDSSLLDPAFGASNYLAPGADRYKISLTLAKKALSFTNEVNNNSAEKFIEFLRVDNGQRIKDVDYNLYSDLEDNLARRTFEQSGDFTIEPFQIDVQEDSGDATKLNIGLEAGKAFVKGYEHRTISTEFISGDKGRDTDEKNNIDINGQYGNYVIVTDVQGNFQPTELMTVNLVNTDIAGTDAGNFATNTIGTASLRAIEYNSGTGSPLSYRFYLFNIEMDSNETIKDVNSIWSTVFVDGIAADIDTTNGQDGSNNTLLFATSFNKLLFKTPNTAVSTLKPLGVTDTDFKTQREFEINFTSGTAAINVTGSNTFFGASGALSDTVKATHYLVVLTNVTAAGATGLVNGDVVSFDSPRTITLSSGNQVATFDINDGAFAATAKIIGTVNLNVKTEKVKTLTSTTETGLTLTSGTSSLNYSDVFDITSITDTGDADADVTDLFDFDTGQRDNFYDHGSITIKDGESIVGPLDVEFRYFTHSGSGYISVDSYTSAIDYEDIPTYESEQGEIFELRDVIDFRPRRTDNDTTFQIPAGGVDLISPNTNLNADYIFYLPRIDKVVLRSNRTFDIIKGTPSLNPVTPDDDEDAMTLYTLKIPAYTFDVDDVGIEFVNNRTFTMKDIGVINERLKTVEYYTALSLLEKETEDLIILDSSDIELFKSGILVDSFNGHRVGDVSNPDYTVSIDFNKRELRPSFTQERIKFTYDDVNSSDVQETGDLITLEATEEELINQPLQNDSVNANPFAISSFKGTMKLSPETDNWYDGDTLPKVVTNTQGENDGWKKIGFGTQWNDWIDNWTGVQSREENESGFKSNTVSRSTERVDQLNTRNNLKSKFSPNSVERQVGTKIVNESIVPYIDPQDITFDVKGLKPNTVVYPFFDGTDVSANVTPTGGSLGGTITTDANGAASGTFSIPSGFKTGERLFRLTDSSTNSLTGSTTVAEKRFVARGLINTREQFLISSRPAILNRRAIDDTVLVRDPIAREQISSNNSVTNKNWIDPLAQTFSIDSNNHQNGVFLKDIDLFFKAKDSTLPVTIEIRPVINGYPHQTIAVPFSQVTLEPNSVLIDTSGATATTFSFDSPVYLTPGRYAIIVSTASDEYELFYAKQGTNVADTENRATRQPYVLKMFNAQNIKSYRGDENNSLKFLINRYEFESSGTVILNNIQPTASTTADVLYLLTSQISLPNTTATFSYKIKDETSGSLNADWIELSPEKNLDFSSRKIVENGEDDTLQIKIDFTSSDSSISPIIDLQRFGAFLISNTINNDNTDEDSTTGGSATARYITRKVTLESGFDADGLKVFLNAYNSSQTTIEVYRKVLSAEDGELFDNKDWVLMTDTTAAGTISVNENDFKEFEFTEESITYDGYTDFNRFAIKIVLLSGDPTDVPKVSDLRVIATRS